MAATTSEAPSPKVPNTSHEIRAIAVAACRDPRTVVAAYRGLASANAHAAVASAAVALGYAPLPGGPHA